eukprot:259646-Pyramimonas_sp.AAC.1
MGTQGNVLTNRTFRGIVLANIKAQAFRSLRCGGRFSVLTWRRALPPALCWGRWMHRAADLGESWVHM